MKAQNRGPEINSRVTWAVTLAMTTWLCACGGGGGSDSSTTPAANLSAEQQSYESFVLAKNGGQHYVDGTLGFSTSSTGATTVNTATSHFFTENSSLAQSPAAAGPQMLTTGKSTIDPALAVPTQTGQRYLVSGRVVVEAVPAQVRVSYNGSNVEETELASDGQTATMTLLGTSYTIVPLSGAISNSPPELFSGSALGVMTNTINGISLYNQQVSWQAGAAYMKVVRQVVGDTVVVGDCATPNTTGSNVTPCATTASQLEAFFPHASISDNKTYNLSDGQIVTLAGTRAWVANVAQSAATTQYRVYFQNNGQIFSGVVIKDGTPLALSTGTATPQNFFIFLNNAAVQSVASAITF